MSEQKSFYAGILLVIGLSLGILGWLATRDQFRNELDSLLAGLLFSQSSSETDSTNNSDVNSVLGDSTPIGNQDEIFDVSRDQLYLLINAHRKENKLTPLTVHPALEKSALSKVNDMVEHNYFRHEDVANTESWYLFKQAGYYFTQAGENLSFNHNSPWQVFAAWVESPPHNQQLLVAGYEDMGLAVDCESFVDHADGGCIVVLHLGAE